MSLIRNVGKGASNLNKLPIIFENIKQDLALKALKSAVVPGGDGQSTLQGIAPEDTIVAAINLTDETKISATPIVNAINYTGDLSGKNILVLFLDVSALITK